MKINQERKLVLTSSKKAEKKFNVKVEKILAFDPEYSSDTICISP